MACGNNHVNRSSLTSQPHSVGKAIAVATQKAVARFKGLETMPANKVDFYVDETGRLGTKKNRVDGPRHVHIVYNAENPRGRNGPRAKSEGPTGRILVQVTDRTQHHDLDKSIHGSQPLAPHEGGHHEMTLFLRPTSPERVEREVTRAMEMLRSRTEGSRPGVGRPQR